MNKEKLIQQLIRKQKFTKYVEIGTNKGFSLLPMKCRQKFAVDPTFKIRWYNYIKWYILNPDNFKNRYFQETSDDFFLKREGLLREQGQIDVFLVDGLHTFEQSLQDVLNALKYLSPAGLIVMHDCYPPDEIAATPARDISEAKQILKGSYKDAWCGDVWKTILYLREKHADDLDISVINTDFGLGIVRKKTDKDLDLKIDQQTLKRIKEYKFSMVMNDPSMLNLKEASFARELIAHFSD